MIKDKCKYCNRELKTTGTIKSCAVCPLPNKNTYIPYYTPELIRILMVMRKAQQLREDNDLTIEEYETILKLYQTTWDKEYGVFEEKKKIRITALKLALLEQLAHPEIQVEELVEISPLTDESDEKEEY